MKILTIKLDEASAKVVNDILQYHDLPSLEEAEKRDPYKDNGYMKNAIKAFGKAYDEATSMKIDDIMKAIADLAKSQGFYGRLLEQLNEIKNAPDQSRWNALVAEYEGQHFKEPLDMVLYFEQ